MDRIDHTIDIPADGAAVALQAGDRVKAVSGQYAGETGMLLVVDDAGVAVMMLDSSQGEAKLFARDLTLSKERSQGIDRRPPPPLPPHTPHTHHTLAPAHPSGAPPPGGLQLH